MQPITRNVTLLASLLLLTLLTAACTALNTPTPGPNNSIHNIVWEWISVTDQTTRSTTKVEKPQDYTIILRTDGTLSGKADCNNFTGVYSQASGFTITLDASTEAVCGEESLDQQYLELLAAIAAGGPDGAGNLALETAGGAQRMLFANGGEALP